MAKIPPPWPYAGAPKPDWWDDLAARIASDSDWYAKYAAAEFDRGNPYPLIGLVHGYQISNVEVAAIRQGLESSAGKQTKAELRRLEQKLIASAVDRMMDEEGLSQTKAIAAVEKELGNQGRGRSTRHIKAAIADYGKRRNYRS